MWWSIRSSWLSRHLVGEAILLSPLVSSVSWITTWLYSLLLEAWPFWVFTTTAQWEARQVYLYRDKSADLKRKAFDCSSVQVRASSSLFSSNLCLIYICTGSISHRMFKSCPQIAIFSFFQFSYKLKTVSHLADVGVGEFLWQAKAKFWLWERKYPFNAVTPGW